MIGWAMVCPEWPTSWVIDLGLNLGPNPVLASLSCSSSHFVNESMQFTNDSTCLGLEISSMEIRLRRDAKNVTVR